MASKESVTHTHMTPLLHKAQQVQTTLVVAPLAEALGFVHNFVLKRGTLRGSHQLARVGARRRVQSTSRLPLWMSVAYTYAFDDKSSTFTCAGPELAYDIEFCPGGAVITKV